MSSISMPWSVKGVSDEARAVAKVMAAQSGKTIGSWLNDVITAAAPDEAALEDTDAAAPTAANDSGNVQQSAAPKIAALEEQLRKTQQTNAELLQLVLKMAQRQAALEKDTVGFAASFQDQLSDLRTRLQRLEAAGAIPAAVTVRRSGVEANSLQP